MISSLRLLKRQKKTKKIPLPAAAIKLLKSVSEPDLFEELDSKNEVLDFEVEESVVLLAEEEVF